MKKIKNLSSLTSSGLNHPNSSLRKNKNNQSEFQEILEKLLADSSEEIDEYKLRLPKQGSFWDDGYKDIRDIG